ncbi:hypothetical protein Acr_03g0014740 [Actinidia rufa]|uniref:Retrotransposon gag domain-containing protein n=1 Tax=Actinidia rufa TaxID=165716 RepID=A0A7J0EE98_9ERIC|nr:hypothetical protein Acr_03g0014740 [Actinidia rufa]
MSSPRAKVLSPPRLGRGRVLGLINPHLQTPSPPESYLYMETTPCEILSSTAPTITGYSPDGNLSNYVSYISEISFHTHPSEDHAVIHGHGPLLRLQKGRSPIKQRYTHTHAQYTLQLSFELFYPRSSPWSDHHAGGVLSGLTPALHLFWRRLWERQFSMHLRSRNLPRPSASSPLDNRAPPMANASPVPDLEAAPSIPDIERSRHSNHSGDRSHNVSTERARDRHRAPSPSLRERSSSSESSQTRSRMRRGRSPHRGGNTRARDKSTSQKIRDLDARLDAINTGTNAPITVDALVRQTDPPFTERVLRTRISSKFKLPTQLGIYEGKTDPMDHLDLYKSLMSLQGCSDEVMCKAFSATLKGPARSWFRKLSPGTVDSFGELSRLFVANFMSCRNRQKNASHLDKVIIMAMMEGLRPGPLFDSLSKNVPETLSALQSKADKYIAAEELAEAKRRRRGKEDHKRKEPDTRRVDYREETRYKRPDRDSKRSNNRRPRTPPRRPEFNLPSLNTPVAQVLSEIKHEKFIKWPGKIKTDPQKRNRNKYCEFHRDHGHNTEDCFQLREQIADLIKRGYLRKYITDRPPPHSPERKYGDNRPTAGNIQTIHGGFGSGGCSTSSRKKHARSAFRSIEEEVYNLSSPCASDQPPITFSSNDLRGLHLPHDDALVVSAVIANFNVQRILIDSGSSADILFVSAFEKMKIGLDKLHPFHTPLIGFGGNTTHPLGWINLPITLGTEPQQTTVWQDFIVVDCPSPYNSILGRPTLGRIKVITSTYHLKVKFPTSTGIGEVKGDQKVARQCFISAMKLILEDPRETENTKPLEEVTPISIHPNYPERQVMIGTELTDELRIALTDFLKRNSDVFAWSQGDVPGIDPEVAMHKLFTKPDCSPVRQKRRKFAPEHLKVIEEEISKLIKAKPRTAIKAQALSDFIVESTHEDTPQPEATPLEAGISKEPTSEQNLAHWILYVDGSSNQHGCGAGLILRVPSGEQMECIPLEFLTHPSIGVANQILQTEENPTWLDEIINYLRKGILPKDKLQARRLQYRSASFVFSRARLYKRSFFRTTLEMSPTRRKLNTFYEKYTKAYVGITPEPDRWQRKLFAKDIFGRPWNEMRLLGIDILGPLPRAPLQRKFLIVAIDYFTKWIEAQPLAKITEENTRTLYGSTLFADSESQRLSSRQTPGSSTTIGSDYFVRISPSPIISPRQVIPKPTDRAMRASSESTLTSSMKKGELRITPSGLQRSDRQILQRKSKAPLIPPWRPSLAKGNPIHERSESREARSNMEGPYKVIKVSRPGTCWLEDLNGKALPHPWNAEHLKSWEMVEKLPLAELKAVAEICCGGIRDRRLEFLRGFEILNG